MEFATTLFDYPIFFIVNYHNLFSLITSGVDGKPNTASWKGVVRDGDSCGDEMGCSCAVFKTVH